MEPVDAERLYRHCRDPDPRTREAAYAELGRLLHRIAWRQAGDDPQWQALADDCAQEALETVWRHVDADRGPDHPDRFVAWAVVIVVNKVREAIRRLDPHPEVRRSKRVAQSLQVSLDAPGQDDRTPAQTLADAGADVAGIAETADLSRLVAEIGATAAVSDQSRFVLIKGFIEGWDDDELAEALGTTRSNVHVIRSRDLAKLRADRSWMERLKAWYGP